MLPAEHQQQRRDATCERFVRGPAPHTLPARLSAAERRRDELDAELELARRENDNLKRRLDIAQRTLARARDVLAEIDPGRYWQEQGL